MIDSQDKLSCVTQSSATSNVWIGAFREAGESMANWKWVFSASENLPFF